MRCHSCGASMTTKRENFRYDASGLTHVTLRNVEVSRCPKCGEYEVAIPAIEQLHAALARALVTKRERLVPEEVRFLRKHLGLSGADFARLMDAAPETVSRWERGSASMSVMAERLLRVFVATREPITGQSLEELTATGTVKAKKQPLLTLELQRGTWHAAAA